MPRELFGFKVRVNAAHIIQITTIYCNDFFFLSHISHFNTEPKHMRVCRQPQYYALLSPLKKKSDSLLSTYNLRYVILKICGVPCLGANSQFIDMAQNRFVAQTCRIYLFTFQSLRVLCMQHESFSMVMQWWCWCSHTLNNSCTYAGRCLIVFLHQRQERKRGL